MGYAHGELMKEKTQQLMHDVWEYMKLQVVREKELILFILFSQLLGARD